eukprot:6194875-Pleurochrysis_carterae.AAC.1
MTAAAAVHATILYGRRDEVAGRAAAAASHELRRRSVMTRRCAITELPIGRRQQTQRHWGWLGGSLSLRRAWPGWRRVARRPQPGCRAGARHYNVGRGATVAVTPRV